MIPGREATHTWDGALVLNDRLTGAAWPRYKVDQIGGLRGLADFTPDAEAAQGKLGEIPRTAQRAGRTITYEGRIIARDVAELRAGQATLLAAFQGTSERRMTIATQPGYTPAATRYFDARAVSADAPEELVRPVQSLFMVALRLSDPRLYDPTEVVQAFDTPGSGYIEATVVNDGNAISTDPVIEITGPVDDPVLVNVTISRTLVLVGSLAVDDALVVDFAERTVTLNGANARDMLDLGASAWWDADAPGLVPGTNVLRIHSVAAPPAAECRFHPAYVG